MKLNKIKTIVEECLKNDVSARNSDWKLYEDVCKKLGISENITLHEIVENSKSLPTFESVSRARRKAQETGLYPANNAVRLERNRNEFKFRKEFA